MTDKRRLPQPRLSGNQAKPWEKMIERLTDKLDASGSPVAAPATRGLQRPLWRVTDHRTRPKRRPRDHPSPSTFLALSRRNFGHTSSLNGTLCMSVMMRSSDRPIGK